MYRIWKEIRKIRDPWLKMALSLINLDEKDALRLIEGFPECFSEDKLMEVNPVPLMVIFAIEAEMAEEGWKLGKCPVSHGAFDKLDIPKIEYGLNADAVAEWDVPLLPESIDGKSLKIGDKVEILAGGGEMVVIENNNDPSDGMMTIWFAPSECIDVDS